MRLLHAKFKGLKGIYNKSGIKEIEIDFSKCLHRIIYIIGQNGSGKSTLLNSLNPLPDVPSNYLDGEDGYKELLYIHGDIMYRIKILYPVYSNNNRAATKAFFTQIDDNGEVELNSNGTVGSFKDIVYSKFNLDPNFVSLTHLSVEDRGLVERKPADRKKFVVSLLESVEIYNDIYKTLVKRSSTFKSFINSITSKMDSIGDENKLLLDKNAADQRYAALMEQRSSLEQSIASARATISLIDPDNKIRESYDITLKEYNETKHKLSILESTVPDIGIVDLDQAVKEYADLNAEITSLTSRLESIDDSIKDIILRREEESKMIFMKNQRYQSMVENSNIGELKKSIAEYRKKIYEYQLIFKKIGIKEGILTKDEYITILNLLENIRTTVVNIKGYATNKSILYACDCILNNNSVSADLERVSEEYSRIDFDIQSKKEEVSYYNGLLDRVKILDNRPKQCTISECSFIKDALDAKDKKPEENILRLTNSISDLIQDMNSKSEEVSFYQLAFRVYSDINGIIRLINSNRSLLDKTPIGRRFSDITTFISRVKDNDPFNDIQEIYSYINYANIFELYELDNKTLSKLESSYEAAKSQEGLIDDLQKEIEDLSKKVNDITSQLEEKQKDKLELQKQIIDHKQRLDEINSLISILRKISELNSSKQNYESQLRLVSDNIEKISKEIDNINKYEGALKGVNSELIPVTQMRDNFTFSLTKLEEYKQELQEYQDKYNLIELLKKYSSPTKGGIQTIFMQLYMDKTLSLANQLLGMLFNGDIELLPYIINENEFRIPTRSNITNLVTDDVSNCSTSEKSMIAMILSFALAFHGSQTYNIVRLDEVDGGLDQANRAIFPLILDSIIQMLQIEQCFIISHSSESDMSDVDVISLTPVSNETIKGNVIFQL